MRKIYIFLIVISLASISQLSAQHYIGARGGWGGGSARLLPVQEMGYEWGLTSGGISYRYYSDQKVMGGVQIDLQFMQKGYNYDIRRKSDTSYHRRINAVDLPIMFQPHIYLFQRSVKIFFNVGVNFSYNINSKYSYVSKKKGILEGGNYPLILTRDNKFAYGLCGGAGLSILTGRTEWALEARYYYGFSDVLRNKNKYETNPLRSPLDNINISFGVYYRLGKEGIRSPISISTQRKIEETQLRREVEKKRKETKSGN